MTYKCNDRHVTVEQSCLFVNSFLYIAYQNSIHIRRIMKVLGYPYRL